MRRFASSFKTTPNRQLVHQIYLFICWNVSFHEPNQGYLCLLSCHHFWLSTSCVSQEAGASFQTCWGSHRTPPEWEDLIFLVVSDSGAAECGPAPDFLWLLWKSLRANRMTHHWGPWAAEAVKLNNPCSLVPSRVKPHINTAKFLFIIKVWWIKTWSDSD